MFRRSVVLLNRLAPDRGAFPHALELAQRLRIPLYGVTFSTRANLEEPIPRKGREESNLESNPAAPQGTESGVRSACACACARTRVVWEWLHLDGDPVASLRKAVAPKDVLVFEQALLPGEKDELVHHAMAAQTPAVLVCPGQWNPLNRALLVDQGFSPPDDFLLWAAALCRRLGVETIVVTVARSERLARQRQGKARLALAGQGLNVAFDSLIGAEIRGALACVARWRRCQLVVVQRAEDPAWLPWLRRASTDWMINGSEFASFLSLPGTAFFGSPTSGLESPSVWKAARPENRLDEIPRERG
jgi:hypothetical protein